jgi:hypothetical protein
MDVDLEQAINDYDINTVAYYSQKNLFKQRLGLQLSDSITLVSELSYDIVEVDEELAVNHGLCNRIELREHEIGIELEIRNTVKQLRSSLRRLQLLEQHLEIADKSFEISRQRFTNGDIDSQALALERNRLNLAYIAHLNSYILYKLLLADLMRKLFYDFENGRSVIQNEI